MNDNPTIKSKAVFRFGEQSFLYTILHEGGRKLKHIKQALSLLITLGLLVSLIVPTVSAADTSVAPAEPASAPFL